MSHLDPTPAAPARRGRRTLILSIVAATIVAAVIVVLAVVWIGGQRPGNSSIPVGVSIDGDAVAVNTAPLDEAQLEALTDLSPAGYVAMQPFVVANHEVRDGAVSFDLLLPLDLPDGAFATFAYLDTTIGQWTPVATRVEADQRTLVAAPPASASAAFYPADQVWTVVIGGVGDAVDAVVDGIDEAGAAITDIADAAGEHWDRVIADWGEDFALGSQWFMRVQRDLLGTGADTPACEPDADGAVPWVADTFTSDNAMIEGLGIEGGNAAVLICVGPDPVDPSLLQVRASANRSYGFPVRVADGIVPASAGMDALEPSTSTLIGAAYSAIASGVDLLLNPGAFILPGQTYSLSVDEATVRASHQQTSTDRIVEYPLPAFPQVLLSGFLGAALEELDPEDFFAGAMGVFFLARDCDVTQWSAGTAWSELAGSISTCLEALDSDALQNAASDVARSVAEDADDAASADAAAAFVSGGAEKARRLIGKLTWLALFSAAQTVSDHINDVGIEELTERPAWFVDATVTAAPDDRWEDAAGTWCGIVAPCFELVLGTTQTEWGTSTVAYDRMMGDCFAGSSTEDPGSGASIVYCPAGAATPSDVPGLEPGLPPGDDDPAFDRLFIYQGYGAIAWFRSTDLDAVKAS
ncbi:hypothetical protein AB0N73_05915 [Microbacterium sp. NPDC089189]|uniref:hypothetical protein n=1 Tax=Microbacterium sp. NPDC089189 TaxID=3154972 RepID=UPI003432BC63